MPVAAAITSVAHVLVDVGGDVECSVNAAHTHVSLRWMPFPRRKIPYSFDILHFVAYLSTIDANVSWLKSFEARCQPC